MPLFRSLRSVPYQYTDLFFAAVVRLMRRQTTAVFFATSAAEHQEPEFFIVIGNFTKPSLTHKNQTCFLPRPTLFALTTEVHIFSLGVHSLLTYYVIHDIMFSFKYKSIMQKEGHMDIQRKKGMLDTCVLSVLKQGPSYGYELIGRVSSCIPVSESTLYPILKRLEASGCLTTYKQEHNGRLRKYYQITEAGEQKIRLFLEEWSEMERIYAFVKHMSQEETE